MSITTNPGRQRLGDAFRGEAAGGVVLLVAALAALLWANSAWRGGYHDLSGLSLGPASLQLDLPLSAWAAEGLLTVFFLGVGLELKHEIVAGSLRNPREALVPMLAAVGGMIAPAAVFVLVVLSRDDHAVLQGWAIPTATDIAFALAVLAVAGRGLAVSLRTFLLTLAVVDDLLAIGIIAFFYTERVDLLALLGAAVAVALFAVAARSRRARWWILGPMAIVAWWCMHTSGVHATVAGVLLGFCVPAVALHGEDGSRATRWEHRVSPWTNMAVLPVFAFFAAGVTVVGTGDSVLRSSVTWAVAGGLVVGKVIGVLGTTALLTALTGLRLPDGLALKDLVGVAALCGIGFTVALLVADLSFDDDAHLSAAKAAILGASLCSALVGAATLRFQVRARRRSPDRPSGSALR